MRQAASPRAPSLFLQLDTERNALDRLIADIELGVRSQAHYDQLATRAEVIGQRLRDAFRAPAQTQERG